MNKDKQKRIRNQKRPWAFHVITDFVNGTDLIGLEDRTYSDLTILDSGLDTRIIDTNSSKILFVLQSFDHTLIDIADFVVTDFV